MGALMVIELQKAIERRLEPAPAGEILPPEGDAPVLVHDGFLQPLDEAVGPRVSRLGAGHTGAQPVAAGGEGALDSFPLSVSTRRNRQPACR